VRKGVIYKLSINKYFIIGSTLFPKTRKSSYISKLKRGVHNNPIVQDVYNTHPADVLNFEIIQNDIPENILTFVEDIWIGASCARVEDKRNGMNCRDAYRVRFTQAIKDKMSISMKGKVVSEETRLKLSKVSIGVKKSELHKHNISKGKLGIKFSDEHKLKLSLAKIGKIPWNKKNN